jgi:hypothetical protein
VLVLRDGEIIRRVASAGVKDLASLFAEPELAEGPAPEVSGA